MYVLYYNIPQKERDLVYINNVNETVNDISSIFRHFNVYIYLFIYICTLLCTAWRWLL